jgi:hypothetical protein
MRNHLAQQYSTGGIAAEVIAGDQRFAVFRSYGLHSFALVGSKVEDLFAEGARSQSIDFLSYVETIGEAACLQHMGARELPVTGQSIEWPHVLCWLARDQGLGLRNFFEWRHEDGAGLRRKAKDTPALTRLVLGLLSDVEAKAESRIARLNADLAIARNTLRGEELRGADTRAIVEAQLRTWAGASSSLQMVSDDLFAGSVEQEIQRRVRQLEAKNDEDRETIAVLDRELIELASEIGTRGRIVELAKGRWDESVALRNNDGRALTEIRGRRDQLLQLVGSCQYGGISYSDCSYIKDQRLSISFTAQKQIGVLTRSVEQREEREASDKANYEREANDLGNLHSARQLKTERKRALNEGTEQRLRQLGGADSLRKTLLEWQESRRSPETERLRAARSNVVDIEQKLAGATGAKISAQQQVSERERKVGARFAELAAVFGAVGRYIPSDERRPFHMLRADGDAYTVLEILLGDLTCAADGVESGGAHPGFLILDCPREREMSPQLYDRFIRLVDEVCERLPGLQVVLTTTTPPPAPLRDPPTRVLKLSHASDDDLLLKRRIEGLLERVTPGIQEDEDE